MRTTMQTQAINRHTATWRPVGGMAAVLGLAVAALAAACGDGGRITVAGTVEIREIQLGPLASGRVVRLLKDEGDIVRAGDTIAVLQQPGLEALIDERRARASAAVHRMAEVDAARADSARAANDLARARGLAERHVISAQQFDQLRAAAVAAAARLAAVLAGPSEARAAEAAVAATLSVRDELTIIAPADGIILTRLADRGEAVAAGAPVVSLGLVRDPWIRAYVGERDMPRIAVGGAVTIRADGHDGTLTGRIVEIAPRAEFTPRVALTERERADLVFAIKVTVVGDAAGVLKAGMPVTLRLDSAP